MDADLSRALWFKSSHSGASKDCVEVAHLREGAVGVRDSKNPGRAALVFGPEAWDEFLAAVTRGDIVR